MVKTLLKRKSGINLKDSDGNTALSLAKKFGNHEIGKILEDSGLGKVQNFGGAASTLSPGRASTLRPGATSIPIQILEDSQGLGKVQNFGGASTNRPRAASTLSSGKASTLSPGKASTLGPGAASALSPGGASALGQCTSFLNLRRASAPSGPPNSKDPDVQRPDLSSGTVDTSINPQVADLRKKFGNENFKSKFYS